MNTYIGIDPGMSGALVRLDDGYSLEVTPMPATEKDVWDWFDRYNAHANEIAGRRCFAAIEWIHPAIQGVGKSSMSKLYGSYMSLRMALTAVEIPFEIVKPHDWQKGLGIPKRKPHTSSREVEITRGKNKGKMRTQKYGGETDTQWKNRLKAKAQQLFPLQKVTLKTADALLIALYCKRKHEGTL